MLVTVPARGAVRPVEVNSGMRAPRLLAALTNARVRSLSPRGRLVAVVRSPRFSTRLCACCAVPSSVRVGGHPQHVHNPTADLQHDNAVINEWTTAPDRRSEHRGLMTQHQQLRVLGRGETTEQYQPAHKANEDRINQAQRHSSRSCPTLHAPITAGQTPSPLLEPHTIENDQNRRQLPDSSILSHKGQVC